MLQAGEIDRLVLTRPAVEAGESLGFLPGDLTQKVDPYLRPIYDALHECIGFERVQVLISLNKIEIAPIAFMRGRTLNNSFIILDEAQNCTVSQLKMFLTRIGKNSRMSLSGDVTQIDLERGRSGLEKVLSIMRDTPQIGIMHLEKEDITRHPLVSVIVDKFEGI
jgi:phosphate starvation-inducible PhoH-like protein